MDLGKLLDSGTSKKHNCITKTWIYAWLLALMFISVGYGLGITFGTEPSIETEQHSYQAVGDYELDSRHTIFRAFETGGAILGVIILIFAIIYHIAVRKTKIAIHERGICGIGCSPRLGRSIKAIFSHEKFSLTYDTITSIETTHEEQIIIKIPDKTFMVFAMRANEIAHQAKIILRGDETESQKIKRSPERRPPKRNL